MVVVPGDCSNGGCYGNSHDSDDSDRDERPRARWRSKGLEVEGETNNGIDVPAAKHEGYSPTPQLPQTCEDNNFQLDRRGARRGM